MLIFPRWISNGAMHQQDNT